MKLFDRLSTLGIGLLVFFCFTEACLADIYQPPLVTGSAELSRRNPDDLERILRNYRGPKINADKAADLRQLLAFTLYPDGSARWFRPAREQGLLLKDDDPIYIGYVEAVKRSVPLRLAKLSQIQYPVTCMLYYSHPNKQATLRLSIEEIVIPGRFVITDGHSQNEAAPIELAKIISNFKQSKAEFAQIHGAVIAIWFRLNPDGTVEDCRPQIVEKPAGVGVREAQTLISRMRTAVEKSAPFASATNAPFREPQGRLLVYNSFTPAKFALHCVDTRFRKIDTSFKRAERSLQHK